MTTVSLDIDDASVIRTKYPLIRQLLERYPKLKMTLFFVPYDVEAEMMQLIKIYRDTRLVELKELIDRGCLELVPHGLTHLSHEFLRADKYTMKLALKAIDDVMGKDGLPYVHGFKAPFWEYNQNVVDVLDENDWWIAVDRNQPQAPHTKKYYKYGYSIHEPFWESTSPVWKLHGHMFGSENDFEEHFLNLYKIPLDAEWKFASELLQERPIPSE